MPPKICSLEILFGGDYTAAGRTSDSFGQRCQREAPVKAGAAACAVTLSVLVKIEVVECVAQARF